MKIHVAGPGCIRCDETYKNVINACAELNISADIDHIHDVKEYSKLGVRITPAVIIDGKVVKSGTVPTITDMKTIIMDSL
ncbi:MAG: thioredoxin family protein [Candidatus Marinimicrobia bacterium]|nr:thioredoxin family protein [Candidatus Neomarinimicrobiota bacterium]MBL7059599.1 thioredoxin family protein [Candidatus Neomarinimicrobiota bacterium]